MSSFKNYRALKKISCKCPAGYRTNWEKVIIKWDGKAKTAELLSYPRYHEDSSKRQRGVNIGVREGQRVRIACLEDVEPI